MKPNLKDGKLIPPASLHEGHERLSRLTEECARIALQLADLARLSLFDNDSDYEIWRQSARVALNGFKAERRLLTRWIMEQETDLFRRSYDLLTTLRKEEVPFENDEIELLNQLDKHFSNKGESK